MTASLKSHWESIYSTKKPEEVSWTEEVPSHSLQVIQLMQLPKTAHIADIGGGDSKLVDYLIGLGYCHLTLIDISAAAIARAQKRLGPAAHKVKWIESNVLDYEPVSPIDLWHDRAAFHFLTQPADVEKYLSILQRFVTGFVLLSTFSTNGPDKCSGLPVQQYNELNMVNLLHNDFAKIQCNKHIHVTPAGTEQEFLSCFFRKKLNNKAWTDFSQNI